MKLFTPIINFDFDKEVSWVKISKIKIKKISSKDIADYFGAIVVRDENFKPIEITSLKDPPTQQFSRCHGSFPLNELQNLQLFECKYAFESSLESKEHQTVVYQILNAFRLFKINGITCPVSFDTGTAVYIMHPYESKIKKSAIFTKKEIKKIDKFLPTLSKIDAEDLKLLTNVMENGISILSIVFLMIIIERSLLRGSSSEISFKVKLFASKYLSKYYQYQAKEVFKNVDSAYKLRSRFVHGSSKEINKDEIDKIFHAIYYYTIKLLRFKAISPHLLDSQNRNNFLF